MIKPFTCQNCKILIHDRKELPQLLELNTLLVAITPFFTPFLVKKLRPKVLITLPESVRFIPTNTKLILIPTLHAKIYFTKTKLFLSSANLTSHHYNEFSVSIERTPDLDRFILSSLPLRTSDLNSLLGILSNNQPS